MDFDYNKCTTRTLKKMKKHHRKLRADKQHRERFHHIDKIIKIKQDTYYVTQSRAFESRLFKFLNKMMGIQ